MIGIGRVIVTAGACATHIGGTSVALFVLGVVENASDTETSS